MPADTAERRKDENTPARTSKTTKSIKSTTSTNTNTAITIKNPMIMIGDAILRIKSVDTEDQTMIGGTEVEIMVEEDQKEIREIRGIRGIIGTTEIKEESPLSRTKTPITRREEKSKK